MWREGAVALVALALVDTLSASGREFDVPAFALLPGAALLSAGNSALRKCPPAVRCGPSRAVSLPATGKMHMMAMGGTRGRPLGQGGRGNQEKTDGSAPDAAR